MKAMGGKTKTSNEEEVVTQHCCHGFWKMNLQRTNTKNQQSM